MIKFFLGLFTILLFFCSSVKIDHAEESYKVAIVYSYSMNEMKSNTEFKDEIDFIRSKKNPAMIQSFYLNYNKKMSEISIHENSFKIFESIKGFNPDLVLVYNNIAFEHICLQYLYPNNSQVLIYGVTKSMLDKMVFNNGMDKKKVSGVYYSLSIDKINKIYSTIEAQSFYIVKNNGKYFEYYINNFSKQLSPNKIEIYSVDNLTELKKTVTMLNEKPHGVILFMFDGLIDENHNTIVSNKEIANTIINRNTKHFEISLSSDLSKYGIASSNVMSFKKMNIYEETSFEKILENKLKDSKYSFLKEEERMMIFNIGRIKKLGFEYLLNEYIYQKVYIK